MYVFLLQPKHAFPWSSMHQANPVPHFYRHGGEASTHVYERTCMRVCMKQAFAICCPRDWWSILSYVPGFLPILKQYDFKIKACMHISYIGQVMHEKKQSSDLPVVAPKHYSFLQQQLVQAKCFLLLVVPHAVLQQHH